MTIKPQRYRISFVVNRLYYPFTYPEILESLEKRGYQRRATPPQPAMSGARVYIAGYVAAKKGSHVELNEGKNLIACEGESINRVVAGFKEIIELSEKDFHLEMSKDIDYSEFISSVIVSNSGNPLELIRKFNEDAYNVFDEALGTETAGYTIRIVSKDREPGDKNWFDIVITPRVSTADKEYFVETVFRDEDIKNVIEFASQSNSKIEAIINKIGGVVGIGE